MELTYKNNSVKINLQIITPEKIAYEGEVEQVTLPTKDGEITVLANHIPLISTMKHGELTIKNGNEEIQMAVCNGFVEVKKNRITIMTDIAERSEDIDGLRAQKAKERAEESLKEKDRMSDIAFADVTAAMERSLARIKVARRKKR